MKISSTWNGSDHLDGMPVIEVRVYEDSKRIIKDQMVVIHLKEIHSQCEVRIKAPHPELDTLLLTASTRKEGIEKAIKWMRDIKGKIPETVIFLNADEAYEDPTE